MFRPTSMGRIEIMTYKPFTQKYMHCGDWDYSMWEKGITVFYTEQQWFLLKVLYLPVPSQWLWWITVRKTVLCKEYHRTPLAASELLAVVETGFQEECVEPSLRRHPPGGGHLELFLSWDFLRSRMGTDGTVNMACVTGGWRWDGQGRARRPWETPSSSCTHL